MQWLIQGQHYKVQRTDGRNDLPTPNARPQDVDFSVSNITLEHFYVFL